MKVVILAGGLGTRLVEETTIRPKPMVEIGGRPILWHIMKIYSSQGFDEFVVCLGYKGYSIKEFFANYFLHMSDVTFDMATNSMEVHRRSAEPWRVTLVDTGDRTMTGGRIKRIREFVENDDVFALTYGDGVGDIDLKAELAFHRAHGKLATVAAVRPKRQFGEINLDGDRILSFREKPENREDWVSAGFFMLSPKVIERIEGDDTIWEARPMSSLVDDDEMRAYLHHGFWHPMDTLRDKMFLEDEWTSGRAKWRRW